MNLPTDLKTRLDAILSKTHENEHYNLSTTPKRLKTVLVEDVIRMQGSVSLEVLENIISEVKKNADKLNPSGVSVILENEGQLNFVAYHYESDERVIERIEFRVSTLEKESTTKQLDKYQTYLELKKEFEE